MSLRFVSLFAVSLITSAAMPAIAQQTSTPQRMVDSTFAGLEFRNIGPAFMSGRIADIALHPTDPNTWYVAVGSGGVWKTVNAATTWEPVFDKQTSYSIGSVTIDPANPHVIWVGTGENVGGRHVGFGDGIYRSNDDGATWKNMGLTKSEHISKIIVHPHDSNVIWVAAQGPLWSSGGERGLYKSVDGGATWKKTLGDDMWVGVTDVMIDPRTPDRLYAATWQRHRTVASYVGGGPGTAIYRSEDGGETWTKLTAGLPTSNMGKIGLAISPQQPDVVYAAIELDRTKGGVFRSTNRGASWKKMSDAVAGATGPHYYQELYASPHAFDRLYLMDWNAQISDDGGKTFRRMNLKSKHSDNHALAFRPDDPDYLLIGTDGGLYQSFDLAKTWQFVANLPVTQFYKVALDDSEPFYNIFGGTQDNSTQGGPSRTDNLNGIRNADWKLVLDWDGHQPATEPGNPNIMYAERQEGTISRIDMITGETVDIKPQAGADDPFERFNWDAPILVSPHQPSRIYFASYRVWRSDNRGDKWTAISGDLTRNQERMALPIMGRVQSWDNAWDFNAMSTFNTITSLAESPVEEGVIYAGTDDGLIQVTEDGGGTWRRIEVGSLPGVPARAFVNDIKADLYDANTVYVALDNHKEGDFRPFLLKSADRGRTWQSIRGNIPDRTLVWRLVQDHVKPGLLFAATEWGVYFTVNGGARWTKLIGGVPTISFRDLGIQRRENDLVGASFGRGFFVLDDYSALRKVSEEALSKEAVLFEPRDAWWYVPRGVVDFADQKGSQGDAYFVANNPPFGAVFTYYLKDSLDTSKEIRQAHEKGLKKSGADIPFPGWEALEAEKRQREPRVWLTVTDAQGNVVRRVSGPTSAGFHRVAWDLKYPAPDVISTSTPESSSVEPQGFMAAPGSYTVTLSKEVDGTVTPLSDPMPFNVVPLRKGALDGAPYGDVAAFWRSLEDASKLSGAVANTLAEALKRATALETALKRTPAAPGELDERLHRVRQALLELDGNVNGLATKREVGEKTKPTISARLSAVTLGVGRSTYGPTETNKESLAIVQSELTAAKSRLNQLDAELTSLADALVEAGGPWVEGEEIPD